MTGVGLSRGPTELGDVAIEVRSVNGRGLAIKSRLAAACLPFEAELEQRTRERLARGQVRIAVEVVQPLPGGEALIDEARAAQAADQLRALAQRLQLLQGPSLSDILAVPGVLTGQSQTARVSRALPAALAALFDRALEALIADRQREGRATVAACVEQLDVISAESARAAKRAPEVIDEYRARLLRRVNELLEGQGRTMSEQDVLREVALVAERSDVEEELVRLQSHVDQASEVFAAGGEVGRKLEFLLQEVLREINTLGSKSADVEMARAVVAMKSAVDRLREQSANLE